MFKTIRYAAIFSLGLLATLPPPAFSAKRPPADYVDPVTDMEFMAIPGGTFVMGDNTDKYARPAHEVTIKSFLLGRYEVTFDQYAKFCFSTGRLIPFDNEWGMVNRPVINVTWQDAVDFTKWLSEKTNRKVRLPSEAEWEYAAHGGTTAKFPWGNELLKNQANCDGCGSEWDNRMTAPAGSFLPNGYNLHDMTGNVYEWCLDGKNETYNGAPVDGSAWTAETGNTDRINRGGSWARQATEMAITRRCWDMPHIKSNELGFRVLIER